MTEVEQLASFAIRASYDDLSSEARHHLKLHFLDSICCAIGAQNGDPIQALRAQISEFAAQGPCTLIGGDQTSPDRAACYNTGLVRYLDFMDNFLAKKETCHPSDNLGSVLAAADYANCSGRDFLAALAVAYQIQCRLLEVAPITPNGFDHTTQAAFSMAAGISRALALNDHQAANAIALSASSSITLWVTRIHKISQWKGLLSSQVALGCTHACFLAKHGVTGPLELFEAPDGYKESVSGDFEIDWSQEDLERVTRTAIKPHNAEVHTQSIIEGVLELTHEHAFQAEAVEKIEIETFKTAYEIVGGGEGGDKHDVHTKEQADHSIPYVGAVAILDGKVWPEQYVPDRINRPDVQTLLCKVTIKPNRGFTRRYPAEVHCRVTIHLKNGEKLTREKKDFEGFFTRPMCWEQVVAKFNRLTEPFIDPTRQREIVGAVESIENLAIRDLMRLLAKRPT